MGEQIDCLASEVRIIHIYVEPITELSCSELRKWKDAIESKGRGPKHFKLI